MKKLSQKEGIAVVVGVLAFLAISPFILGDLYSSGQQASAVDSVASNGNGPQVQVRAELENAILNFDVQDIYEGDGAAAEVGDTVYVHYVGMLANGNFVDTSTNSEEPLAIELGSGEVIIGWDLGLIGMREGGTRRLVIPSELAYGDEELIDENGNVLVPANATLMFDIVLMKVQKS